MASETRLTILGMTCGHCRRAVEEALQGVPGADRVEVDLDAGAARVWGKATHADLVSAVTEAGYEIVD